MLPIRKKILSKLNHSIWPCVVAAITTLQNFALAYFGASLPTLHNTFFCFVKYSSFSVFLAQRQLVDHSGSIPLTGFLLRVGPAAG